MELATLDWIIIIAFLIITVIIAISLKSRAEGSLTSFFLGGRNLPWYIAGLSMVATTFAADTPLLVTELVRKNGISGNWLWWNMLIGGMLTTFFFARLWRRANIITEIEFLDIRYGDKLAHFLRGFKAVYLGIFINAMIIGWVNFALMKILNVYFGFDFGEQMIVVAGAMIFVAAYSSMSGLLGVAVTDVIQFTLAMTGSVILAVIVLNNDKIGGIEGLTEKLDDWQLSFFPAGVSNDTTIVSGGLALTFGAFMSFLFVQWWASWYPGSEPGGGGYISQRMMSAKNEKHAIYSSLFFQIAHYCLRPWPWIIVGLASIVLYPDIPVADGAKGYVMVMKDNLPVGLQGLLLAAFLGAYMSTISTQLNWGSSYLTNDFYKSFLKKEEEFDSEEAAQKKYVKMARVFTVLIMVISLMATTQITSIESTIKFLIACGSGLGGVLILRWYWWRINSWSELAATVLPFVGYAISIFIIAPQYIIQGSDRNAWVDNEGHMIFTALLTTVGWVVVTFLTSPTDNIVLENFYKRIKPKGAWKSVRKRLNEPKQKGLRWMVSSWLSSVVMIYSVLFLLGFLIFKEWNNLYLASGVFIISLFIMIMSMKKSEKSA